ncbi:MAG: hypothetical protein NTAFB09_22810 [Nitrosospira sp.]
MTYFDAFNGDADGICALHQLRLAEPRGSVLVTGVKRNIGLLKDVRATRGDHVVALDISLDKNREPLLDLLDLGVSITYVDHHFAGDIPIHPGLSAVIDPSSDVCTSLLVDRMLDGRFRIWAAVAAFGDGLPQPAMRLAAALHLSEREVVRLRELGECLNYNAYGDTVEDLFFHPAELYCRLHSFSSPFDFLREETVIATLREGFAADMALASKVNPEYACSQGKAYILPDEPWSRRVSGSFGNHLAQAEPLLAHAILTARGNGGYVVSVRSPLSNPFGADTLCNQFESGGGRKRAAGVNHLPESDLAKFFSRFSAAFDGLH